MHDLLDQRRYLIPFRSGLLPQIFTDTLVIGAGAAGLRAAIAAATHGEVIVVAKSDLGSSNTAWAQGGIAGSVSTPLPARSEPGPRVESSSAHVEDTIAAGAGLCDGPAVRFVVDGAPARLGELVEWGMRFDRADDGSLHLGREGGHSAARILHAGGDSTGAELARCLDQRARALDRVRVFEHCFALDLLTPGDEPGSPVMGAITHHARYGLQVIWARATILAGGGCGVIFRETTNPRTATGDALALAYRAGATLADMAFVQFHPTTLYVPGAARVLVSEAVRGEGAHLLDSGGRRFMLDEHPLAELAPRDVVSRAIVRQIAQQGGRHVWLDARHVRGFAARFPGITATLREFQIDPASQLVPVHPAAHYFVGGVRTDLSGRTDVPGLYAAGEVASTGLHGANRLASNSLLEALVMGEAAGRACEEMRSTEPRRAGAWTLLPRQAPVAIVSDIRPSAQGELDLADVRSSLRSAMWRNVGIDRTGAKLRDAVDMLTFWARYTLDKIFDEPEGWETQNMLLVASLIAASASWREESRGCHRRDDFPEPRAEFRAHDLWRRARSGERPRPPRTIPVREAQA